MAKDKPASMEIDMKGHMAEADLRTLIEAEKIKSDKDRLAAAMKKKKEMMANLKAV